MRLAAYSALVSILLVPVSALAAGDPAQPKRVSVHVGQIVRVPLPWVKKQVKSLALVNDANETVFTVVFGWMDGRLVSRTIRINEKIIDRMKKSILSFHAGIDIAEIPIGGISPGSARFSVMDDTGKKETFVVTVRNAGFAFVGDRLELPIPEKKTWKKVAIENEKIARVEIGKNNTYQLIDVTPGKTSFVATAADGSLETVDVIVASDQVTGKNVIRLSLGDEINQQMAGKQGISLAISDDDALIQMVPGERAESVIIAARKTGIDKLTLTDEKGIKETYDVIVSERVPPRSPMITKTLSTGESFRFQTQSKKAIAQIQDILQMHLYVPKKSEKNGAVCVFQTTRPGVGLFRITDIDSKTEIVKLIVYKDKTKPAGNGVIEPTEVRPLDFEEAKLMVIGEPPAPSEKPKSIRIEAAPPKPAPKKP